MLYSKYRMMAPGKVNAFYREFIFLEDVVKASRVETVAVSRLTKELVEQKVGRSFYLFTDHGNPLGRVERGETLEQAIVRNGGDDKVGYVVEKRVHDIPSYAIMSGVVLLLALLFRMVTFELIVYKPAKGFRVDMMESMRRLHLDDEVIREIRSV